jgi:hypothetical protein
LVVQNSVDDFELVRMRFTWWRMIGDPRPRGWVGEIASNSFT